MMSRPLAFSHDQKEYLQRVLWRGCIPEPNSGCWLWLRTTISSGYGSMTIPFNRSVHLAHRISFAVWRRDLMAGEWVLHKCDNPLCINPQHLFLGDHTANTMDMVRKGRSALGGKNGSHKLTEATVLMIRETGGISTPLMREHGLSRQQVCDILTGVAWPHVGGPRRGSKKQGASHYMAKITEDVARSIFRDPRTHQKIANSHGISREAVTLIKNGKTWRHATISVAQQEA